MLPFFEKIDKVKAEMDAKLKSKTHISKAFFLFKLFWTYRI
jgi:hypothetical protein